MIFLNLDIRKRASEGEYFVVSPSPSPSYRIIKTPIPVIKETQNPNSTPTPVAKKTQKPKPTQTTLKTIGDVFSEQIDNLIKKE